MSDIVHHNSTLWVWRGGNNGSWHFATIDGAAGEAISAHEAMRRLELGPNGRGGRGFGSVKVKATIGDSSWNTSVFPSKPHKGFILPVKAAIRKAQDLSEGDEVSVALELL